MAFEHLLITGGAGFVGSNLAIALKRANTDWSITALDNLKRRGGELNLPRLKQAGISFIHGDIRCPEDFQAAGPFDLLIDCSAEPSVQAGTDDAPTYVLNTNLTGTLNCLELARRYQAAVLFISTSRVYPIAALNALEFSEDATRFTWTANESIPGFSSEGVGELFPLHDARSFYGASKLACELIIQEYVHSHGMRALVDRCGILTGPWQMGKVDQGVVTLWVARHVFGKPLSYIGFGGKGKQVRDLLHINDFADLVVRQIQMPDVWDGRIYNVGGGTEVSTSLMELTDLCQQVTGNQIPITPKPQTSDVDLRLYLTDARKVRADFDWRPTRDTTTIIQDIHQWIVEHRQPLAPVFG